MADKSRASERSKEYWKDRALAREASYQAGSVETTAKLNRAYDRATENILLRLESINRNAAKQAADGQEPYIYRRKLAEAAKAALEREFEQLRKTETKLTAERYAEVMSEAYYKSIFDMQKGTGLGFSFAKLPAETIEKTLAEGWLGRDFSKSVWRNVSVLAYRVQEIVQGGILSGAGIDTMAEQLNGLNLEIDEKMRMGKAAAYRLIRTETNYFANQGELLSYAEAGITHYDYLATLDNLTSEACQELDGKTFPVARAVVGENYPPMHPWCRSTTVAHFDDKTLDNLERRARDPVTGKTMLVPASMNYGQWYDTHVLKKNGDNDIINSGRGDTMKRRTTNTGEFKHLQVPMQLRHVKRIAEKYQISLEGIKLKIQRNPELLSLDIVGSADPEDIGRIDLYPNAFTTEIELARTIFHEKVHVRQFKKYGKDYVMNNRIEFEIEAYSLEKEFFEKVTKNEMGK